jgi:anaerobic magnesium-protoporphyrin IX monomethyl ester cyclase
MLADPPVQEEYYIYYQPTMGILYLLGALRQAFSPADVEVRYLQGFGSMRDHLRAIEDYRPDIYGLSFKTPMARLGHRTLLAVKERFPSLTVIAGGSHVSIMADEVMSMTPTDACFQGECEESVVRIAEAFGSECPHIEEIPGAVYRAGPSLRHTPPAPFQKDLDSFPWPAWDMIEFDRFPGMPYSKRRPYLGVLVSRGCPFRCTFCSEPVWKIFGRPTYRARSPAKIVEEVRYLYDRGVRELRLWCEEFNAGASWATDLLHRIAALDHPDLYLNFNIRGDVMPEAMADAMVAANVWLVSLGFESASDGALKGVQKQVTTAQIENTCAVLASRGIKIAGYFQFYSAWEEAGRLRWETAEDCRRTIRWARDLGRKGLLHYMYTSVSTPRPGTPLWTLALKYGLLRVPPDQPFSYLAEGMRLPGVSRQQVRATKLEANYEKIRLAARNGNLNLPIVFRKARRSLRI